MAAWSDGYFTDVQYTSQFYSELAPGFLAYACLRQGVRPPKLGPGSSYLELGCGQGFGLNLLAAANPQMAFLGADFHPGQIDNAQRLARDAGLANVAFEDWSFEQMLDLPESRLPRFDIVALHGILSWVNDANRGFLVRLLDRVVKPGGLVYASYNCLPGWGPLIPLRRFILEHAKRATGDPKARVAGALKAALQLAEAPGGYFESVPWLKARIEDALRQSRAYLVHEYMHEDVQPFFHADIAREMDTARLAFAASANLADDLIHLAAPAALQPMIREAPDAAWRETLLDYASSKSFRRDIYVRGRNSLDPRERDALLEDIRFALIIPPEGMSLDFQVPIGRLTGQPGTYQPIVEALAEGPRSYGELSRLPALHGVADGVLSQAVTLMVGARQIHPVADAEPAPALAFNRAVIARTAFDEFAPHLAAPLVGTGARLEFTDLLAIQELVDGQDDVGRFTAAAWASMARTGRRLMENGQALVDQAANEAALGERYRRFKDVKLPVFRRLGVI